MHEEGEAILFAVTILKGHYEAGHYVDGEFVPGIHRPVVSSHLMLMYLCFVCSGVQKEYFEPVREAFRESRFTVREFNFDPAKSVGGVDAEIARVQEEMKQVRASTLRWCKAHFGEVYNSFVHLKVIQAFVESVLRYGLPVDFVSFFLEPNLKMEKQLLSTLSESIVKMRPNLKIKKILMEEEESEEASTDTLPFVCQKFPLIGATAAAAGP